MKISAKLSDSLWVMKAFAILSVFFAHIPGEKFFGDLTEIFGTIGVVVFFVLSGFLFNKPENHLVFWRKKLFSIVIPWLFCGVLTFGLSVALGNSFSLSGLFFWVFGFGTWFYYLTLLLVIYLLFSFVDSKAFCFICIILNVVSLSLTGLGVLDLSWPITNHINIFNWIGFFAIGYLLKSVEFKISKITYIASTILFIAATVIYIFIPIKKQYWSLWAFFYELIAVGFIFSLSYIFSSVSLLKNIGKKSFTIYLVNMQFAGIISSRLHFAGLEPVLWFLRPIFALILLYVLIVVFEKILTKLKLDKLLVLIGCR